MLAPVLGAVPEWQPLAPGATPKAAPAHTAQLESLPPGAVMHMVRGVAKSDGAWVVHLHDGSRLQIEGTHRVVHANGDVTWSGTIERAGAMHTVLLTEGEQASFGTFNTPSGPFRFESWGDQGWLIDVGHPQIRVEAPDEGAIVAPGFHPPATGASAAPKNTPVVIDLLMIHSQGFAARYPGEATQTRINHLVALANQIFANSDVPMVLRLVGAELTQYPDSNGPNGEALNAMRLAMLGEATAPEFAGLRARRDALGADLVAFLRPHDIETRGNCGIAYLFGSGESRGVSITSDGFDSWSLCDDGVFTHEIGHNLGAEHQIGATSPEPGFGTAFVRFGQFHTVMGSFGSGVPQRQRRLDRFSNPALLCGGSPCGTPGVADNARRLRNNMVAVSNYRNSVSTVPVPVAPAALDPDVDGDGVPESQDAFPYDARFSSDRDGDGVPDEIDAFPDDPGEWADTDGDGVGDNSDPDIDGDGVANAQDAFPFDPTEWVDSDGDGVGDNSDAFPNDRFEWSDTDGDGVGDNADPDVDGDGVVDLMDPSTPAGSDLLVISAGTDRVLRFDGDSGMFAGVEVAESHIPQALGRQSELAWDPRQKLLHVLVAGEVRRYDRFERRRADRFIRTFRTDGGPLMPSSFPGGLAVDSQGNVFIADEGSKRIERRDGVTGEPLPGLAFGRDDFYVDAPRALSRASGDRLWTIERSAKAQAIRAATGVLDFIITPRLGDGSTIDDPSDILAMPNGNFVLVADMARNRIVRVDPTAPTLSNVFVAPGSGGLQTPAGMTYGPDGHLYVSSAGTDQVLRFNGQNGAFIDVFSKAPPGVLKEPRKLLFVPRVADRFPRDAERRYRPVAGGWFNPARSGHGLDLQVAGNQLLVIWYTYTADGNPTWYLGQGEKAHGVWEAPLLRFTWDGSAATPVEVGSARLVFSNERSAEFSWELPGGSGSEPMQPLSVGTSSETQFPTAAWFDPGESGWGLSVTRQGERAYAIAFIYDPQGQPTWVLGVSDAGPSELVFEADSFIGPTRCPGCPGEAVPTPTPAGSLRFNMLDGNRADVDTSFQATGIDWQRGNADFRRLTDTPTEPNGDPHPAQALPPEYGFPPPL